MPDTYNLANFIRDLDLIVEETKTDWGAIIERGRPLLSRLLADTSWLAPGYYEPRENGSVQYLLHRPPGNEYTITSVVFWQGYTTPVHDHGTWGLIGVWRGEELEERFKRIEGPPDTDRVQLRRAGSTSNSPGSSVTHLLPPDEEIHRIRTVSPYPSCSIHVYGGNIDGKLRHRFDLDTGAVSEFQIQVVTLD